MLEAALFSRKWSSLLFLRVDFLFTFVIPFCVKSDPNPEPDEECIPVPVPLRQKVPIPKTVENM
jgi:hypothetical protein